jgi:hypothetical protein
MPVGLLRLSRRDFPPADCVVHDQAVARPGSSADNYQFTADDTESLRKYASIACSSAA